MLSLNLTGYLVYLPFTFYITFWVGHVLYKSGEQFLTDIFNGNKELAHTFNRLLLTGYYLLNLGYATLSITWWNKIETTGALIHELAFRLGFIILLLGLIHYFNIYVFWRFSKLLKNLYENFTK